jgi:hypothetical protein
MTVLWDTAPCNLFEVDLREKGGMLTSETSVYFNKTTRCYIAEGCHLHTPRPENLKSNTDVKTLWKLGTGWKIMHKMFCKDLINLFSLY